MKYFLLFVLLLGDKRAQAQKYVLLDKHIVQPITYSDKITPNDKFNSLFPVEKKSLKQFVNALEEIAKKLTTEGSSMQKANQYKIGCATFTGLVVPFATGDRLDYVITSTCDNITISMHLSDAKLKNISNAYFINTWIKYIKASINKGAVFKSYKPL